MVSLNVQGLNLKAKKDWVKEIFVSHKVNFRTFQETKMEDISLIDVKCCWGNYAFEYVYSPAVGNSGGILCVWEKSAFKKNNSTISDYFVMIGGSWLCSGVNILIISVYAPQEYAEKKMLWDYLVHVISKWDGEAKKDWFKEICVSHKVNFLTLQETKMEDISLIDVKCCWGNYAFEYVYSPAVDSEDIQCAGSDHDHYQEAACAHHEEHVLHDCVQLDHAIDSHDDYTSDSNIILCDQHVKDNDVPVIHSDLSYVPDDAF
nr:RNA-directed DNA polymerase, eukaryota [Tanacetum cinerariifolium]